MPSHDMPDMKAQVEKMRATLDQMKANLAKIQGSGYLQQHAEFDVELWEAIIRHMEGRVMMMSNAHESADMLKKMSCCAPAKGIRNRIRLLRRHEKRQVHEAQSRRQTRARTNQLRTLCRTTGYPLSVSRFLCERSPR